MIKRSSADARERYGPSAGNLAWSAVKGLGMGALLAMIVVQLGG